MQPIYFQLYELLHMYIYGLDTVLTPDMTLTLTMLSTCGVVFLVSIPFLIVKKFFRW